LIVACLKISSREWETSRSLFSSVSASLTYRLIDSGLLEDLLKRMGDLQVFVLKGKGVG
jgi:hypothetical protein